MSGFFINQTHLGACTPRYSGLYMYSLNKSFMTSGTLTDDVAIRNKNFKSNHPTCFHQNFGSSQLFDEQLKSCNVSKSLDSPGPKALYFDTLIKYRKLLMRYRVQT